MNESAKDSAADVAADMLVREFGFGTAMAERIARRVMSVVLPPLEKEVDRHDDARRAHSVIAGRDIDQYRHLLDHFAHFIESMLRYSRSIRPQRGHYVDVPIDDRAAQELEALIVQWQRLGGQPLLRDERHEDIKYGRDHIKYEPTLGEIEELSRRIDLGVKADTLRVLAEERVRHEQESPGGTRRPTET